MVLSAIGHIARTHPFKFGTVFSCAKTSFSDWLVQTQVEKREHIDWRRNGTFAAFGFFYLGMVQYTLYVPIFSRMFPGAAAYAAAPLRAKLKDVAGTRNMITQVVLDQFVHHPIAYFPVFYCLKEVVNGGTMSGGIEKYKVNYKEVRSPRCSHRARTLCSCCHASVCCQRVPLCCPLTHPQGHLCAGYLHAPAGRTSAGLDSTRPDSTRLDSTRLDPTRPDPT